MKISRLFHWLYASLMLLPLGYILSRCLYVIFNSNAIASIPLDTIFIDSVNNINTLSLFRWALNSFLYTPFSYIANVFSLPVNSPLITLLSYWLSISIIWLTYDVLMYVPLLIHRWLDKGVLE